jgi:hypothetical protein
MALEIETIRDVIISHGLASGYYESVSGHEPKSKPPAGLTGSVLLGDIDPLGEASGLATVSVRLEFIFRTHLNMLTDPQDDIDIDVGEAVNAMFTALVGDFTLGGNVRNIDVFGEHGPKLRARPGYINLSGTLYRVIDLFTPVIVNDAWTQEA